MLGVPKELIEHALKVNPKAIPKKQWLRHFSLDKREAIKKELAKLLAAGFIKEDYHPEWLANPVLIQKKNNNEWRMTLGLRQGLWMTLGAGKCGSEFDGGQEFKG